MGGKVEKIKSELLEWRNVTLGKQCKNEYIVYTFSIDADKNTIIRRTKEHFSDKDYSETGKVKSERVNISLDYFLDVILEDLISRGYDLKS